LWSQQFKYDYPEKEEKIQILKSDILFMERVSQSTTMIYRHYYIGLPLKG